MNAGEGGEAEVGRFDAVPLPRSRAWLALILAAAAFLAVGGVLEYGMSSPMTEGQGIVSYRLIFFAFYALVFGGAALVGAFPVLALRPIKLVWLLLTSILYLAAFGIWHGHQAEPSIVAWLSLWRWYAPALLPIVAGVLWGPRAFEQEERA